MRAPCDRCGLDREICSEYGCPRMPDPLPPDEDEIARRADEFTARYEMACAAREALA